jgi:hypothetical protein
MFSHLSSYVTELKLTLAAIIGIAAGAADAIDGVSFRGWEDVGLKGLLLFAVIFIGRLFLEANRTHKTEIAAIWAEHKSDTLKREDKVVAAIEANTKSLAQLTDLTKEQTDYFKTVTRNVVAAHLEGKSPQLPG